MPRRNLILANGEIYHTFNRSIARETIFSSRTNLKKAIEVVDFYRFPQTIRLSKFKALPLKMQNSYLLNQKDNLPLVEIYSFAFMPNHYHFLLKQLQEGGIRRFLSNFQNSFAKVFNLKNERDGSLFQNSFKAKRMEDNEQFMHVSRYIHLNPVTGYLIEFNQLKDYPWTSFYLYVNRRKDTFINIDFLLGLSGSVENYIQFTSDQVNYQRKLAEIKDLIVE